jgi:hypothetical protein
MSNLTSRPRHRRRLFRAAAICASGALGIAASVLGAACILADPPAELPKFPARRPTILHDSVVPPTTNILRQWPARGDFLIPVEVDPGVTFRYRAFLDYDARTHGDVLGTLGQSDPDPASSDGGIRSIHLGLPPPTDLLSCHTLEIIVALDFVLDHTPTLPPGGDSVVWFYSPTGDLTTCPFYDAGPEDAAPDGDGGTIRIPPDPDAGE